jgi:isoleucyl-tRNA synthetase
MDIAFHCLTRWFAPVLCFTTEEVWQSRFGVSDDSVHLQQFVDMDAAWQDDALAAKWDKIRKVRRVVTGALEVERREKRIGSSLEAAPIVHISDAELRAALDGQNMADICITSQIELTDAAAPDGAFTLDDIAGVAVMPQMAEGKKCQRSWKILPEVGSVEGYPDLTPRDAAAVAEYDAS